MSTTYNTTFNARPLGTYIVITRERMEFVASAMMIWKRVETTRTISSTPRASAAIYLSISHAILCLLAVCVLNQARWVFWDFWKLILGEEEEVTVRQILKKMKGKARKRSHSYSMLTRDWRGAHHRSLIDWICVVAPVYLWLKGLAMYSFVHSDRDWGKCIFFLSELPNYKPRTAWKSDRFRPTSKGKAGKSVV